MVAQFTIAKCKTRAGYSAILKKPAKLNLTALSKWFEVVIKTPILLVIREQGVDVIIHGYGELLFKDCDDITLMETIARRVYEKGLGK